jgi:GNAT superfamily N-acetyltransferase
MIEYEKGNYVISTEKSRLDLHVIHDFLSTQAYWALNRPLEMVRTAIENSICFGLYEGDSQIGFARVVTDYATFAWLCDVFILPEHRSQGLGKWLVECIVTHPQLAPLRRIVLATRDAHELYRKYGNFTNLRTPERWMEKLSVSPQDPLLAQ